GDVDVAVAVGIDAERGALVARRRDAAGIVDDRLAEVRGRHRADALVDAVDDDAASRVGLYKRLVQAVGVGTEGVEAAGIDVAGIDHAAVDAAHQGTVGDAVGRIHGDAAGVLDDRLPDGCPGERARRDATAALDGDVGAVVHVRAAAGAGRGERADRLAVGVDVDRARVLDLDVARGGQREDAEAGAEVRIDVDQAARLVGHRHVAGA